jgi:Amt family ammonium transporter
VYDPIARWSWHAQGWSKRNHSLDFAGGTVVHITSGAAVQAFAVWYGMKVRFLGKWNSSRRQLIRDSHLADKAPHNPHNMNFVVLGTMFMWIGWFGFNGGSALGANTRAASACMCTQIAACFGAVTGLIFYGINKISIGNQDGRESATMYFCDGALNGLVAITPAAGYVSLTHEPCPLILYLYFYRYHQNSHQFLESWRQLQSFCWRQALKLCLKSITTIACST